MVLFYTQRVSDHLSLVQDPVLTLWVLFCTQYVSDPFPLVEYPSDGFVLQDVSDLFIFIQNLILTI
jgi:hypothetical protein